MGKQFCKINSDNHSCVNCSKRTLSLFEGLNETELDLLNQNRVVVNFKKGETIYKENCKPSGLYCLNEGKVKLVKYSHKNREIIISLKRPVDFLDMEALILGSNYTHSAIALEDSSVCIIDEEHFNKVLMNNTHFAKKLLHEFASELMKHEKHFINITQKQIHARVAETLINLSEFYGVDPDGFIDVSLKRQDIASLSGMTPANVIRTITLFEKQNLIESNKKRIKILDKPRLQQIAEETDELS
ncbi:MAG: Crp/Fnr family transcriptional regulator [Bacteroidia bacterium]|nr:MAG: Crp/Fnr family transcriptional regulator [Bacteroidia bacterium]